MKFKVVIHSGPIDGGKKWEGSLKALFRDHTALVSVAGDGGANESAGEDLGEIHFIDASMATEWIQSSLKSIDRRSAAVFLIASEKDQPTPFIQNLLSHELVDDVLIYPFRTLDAWSKLQRYKEVAARKELDQLNLGFSELLEKLRGDLRLVEELQKSKQPRRFPDLRGLKIHSRYLAGKKSGGDFFDLAESRDGNTVAFILANSSSYGLSSALLGVLMRVALKLSVGEIPSCAETVQRIWDEIQGILKETDTLSLCYATLSRNEKMLRYINFGKSFGFYSSAEGHLQSLDAQAAEINRQTPFSLPKEGNLPLHRGGRLIFLSEGMMNLAGGASKIQSFLPKKLHGEPLDCLNELIYGVKKELNTPEELPARDCTAALVEIDEISPNVIQLPLGESKA